MENITHTITLIHLAIQKIFYRLIQCLKKKLTIPALNLSTLPTTPQAQTFSLARFFTRGAIDAVPKRNPTPIPELIAETEEITRPRPIPRTRAVLQTLIRGKGTLRKNAQGLVYLDIDDEFITTLLPYFTSQGGVCPPYFNRFGTPSGAHIPVISSREAYFHCVDAVPSLGKECLFDVEGLYSMEPSNWPEVQEVWFFQVHSSELEGIRKQSFLLNLPSGHPFLIAIAIKKRTDLSLHPEPQTHYRINPTIFAA